MTVKPFLILSLALVAMVAFAANCHAGADADNTKADAKATYDSAKDTVKDVVQQGKDAIEEGATKARDMATNVAHEVKVGAKKAGEVATNVAAKVKQVTTNTVHEVREKVKDVTHKDQTTNPPAGNAHKTNPDAI